MTSPKIFFGSRPKYAPDSDDEAYEDRNSDSSDETHQKTNVQVQQQSQTKSTSMMIWDPFFSLSNTSYAESFPIGTEDRRLRRLQARERDITNEERIARHRQVMDPEVLIDEEDIDDRMELDEENESDRTDDEPNRKAKSDDDDDDDINEDERIRLRNALRQKALEKQEEVNKIYSLFGVWRRRNQTSSIGLQRSSWKSRTTKNLSRAMKLKVVTRNPNTMKKKSPTPKKKLCQDSSRYLFKSISKTPITHHSRKLWF